VRGSGGSGHRRGVGGCRRGKNIREVGVNLFFTIFDIFGRDHCDFDGYGNDDTGGPMQDSATSPMTSDMITRGKLFSVNIRPLGDDTIDKVMPLREGKRESQIDPPLKYNLPCVKYFVTPHVLPSINSSARRVRTDLLAAVYLAQNLDRHSGIQEGQGRLEDVLEVLFPRDTIGGTVGLGRGQGEKGLKGFLDFVDSVSNPMCNTMSSVETDTRSDTESTPVYSTPANLRSLHHKILDVCIAYLRRVHLFVFYDGRFLEEEGEMLNDGMGTINPDLPRTANGQRSTRREATLYFRDGMEELWRERQALKDISDSKDQNTSNHTDSPSGGPPGSQTVIDPASSHPSSLMANQERRDFLVEACYSTRRDVITSHFDSGKPSGVEPPGHSAQQPSIDANDYAQHYQEEFNAVAGKYIHDSTREESDDAGDKGAKGDGRADDEANGNDDDDADGGKGGWDFLAGGDEDDEDEDEDDVADYDEDDDDEEDQQESQQSDNKEEESPDDKSNSDMDVNDSTSVSLTNDDDDKQSVGAKLRTNQNDSTDKDENGDGIDRFGDLDNISDADDDDDDDENDDENNNENDQSDKDNGQSDQQLDQSASQDNSTAGASTHLPSSSTPRYERYTMRLEQITSRHLRALDNKIMSALQKSRALSSQPDVIIDEETDAIAAEIARLQQDVQKMWIRNHTVMEPSGKNDGQTVAKCSFHWCQKRFRDKSFLSKHLIKKHPEYLRAEQMTKHDEYMMLAWETSKSRPIPEVCIDCGPEFGIMVRPVGGTFSHPTIEDPEPMLIMREEQRRREWEAQQESERRRREEYERRRRDEEERSKRRQEQEKAFRFVDVDDVKVEKVDVDFQEVELPPEQPKKKKRRKKL